MTRLPVLPRSPLAALLLVALNAPLALAADAPEPSAAPTPIERRLRLLEEQNARLQTELKELRGDLKSLEERHTSLSSMVSGRIGGYLDFGAFYVAGDGTGIRADLGHLRFPEYAAVPDSWVFMGDPLATAINARGEPSSTGDSRAVTFDPIKAKGVSSFIVNAINLSLFAGLGPNLTLNGLIDFVPRTRNVSDPNGVFLGDFIDVKLAYAEYTIPWDKADVRISVGKIDSVLGFEYRSQEAPARITVTPSLICRYTCGRPIGAKIRGRFFHDLLVLVIGVTNGTYFTEMFPFRDETDSNQFKTVAGRLSTKIPLLGGLELGASGAFGAQDLQADDRIYQYHFGFDLHLEWKGLDVRGEFVQGKAPGKTTDPLAPCDTAACLRYRGAYGQVAYRILNWLMPYVRVDWRDALHQNGQSFVYVSDLMRLTGGLRLDVGEYVVVKAEYTYVRELGRVPQFPDDVFTSALIVKY